MSGIDPKQTSNANQMSDYRRSIKEARENYEKRANDIEERSEKINNKRDQSRNESINQAQKNYETNLTKQKDALEENFISNRKNLIDKLEGEKRNHAKATGDLTKKYYERLEDLNEQHGKNAKELEGNYQESLDYRKRTQDKVLKDQSVNASKKYQSLADDYKLKEDKLVDNQHNRLRKVMKDADYEVSSTRKTEKKKVEEARAKNQTLYEELKRNSETENKMKDQMFDNRLAEIQKNFKGAYEESVRRNQEMNRTHNTKFNGEMREVNSQHKNEIDHLRKDFSERERLDDYLRKKEKQSIDMANNNRGYSPKEARLVNQIDSYKQANKKLLNDIDVVGSDYDAKLDQVNFSEKKIRDNLIASKDRESQAFLDKTLIEERSKQEQMKSSLESKMITDKNEADIKQTQIEKTLKNRIQTLNENYGATLKDVDDKNNLLVTNIKHQNKVDRREYADRVDKDYNARQIEAMKRNQGKMDLQQRSFENQRLFLDKQMTEKENAFDTQIGRLREDTNYNMSVQYDIMNRQKEDTKMALKENAKRKEDDLKSNIELLHSKYARKLNQQEQKFEKQMYSMVKDYENKIRHMSRETTRELAMKTSENIREKKTIAASHDMDKKRLVEYYENLLQNMRTNYEREFDRLKNFLSTASEGNSTGS
jgi:hypothetical protein